MQKTSVKTCRVLTKRRKDIKNLQNDWIEMSKYRSEAQSYTERVLMWRSGTGLSEVGGHADRQSTSESFSFFSFFLSPLCRMGCGWWIVFSRRRIALTNCVLMILFTDHHPAQEGKSGEDMSCVPPLLCCNAAWVLGSCWWRSLVEEIGGNGPRKRLDVH